MRGDTEGLVPAMFMAGDIRCHAVNKLLGTGAHLMYPSKYGPCDISEMKSVGSGLFTVKSSNGILVPSLRYDEPLVLVMADTLEEWSSLIRNYAEISS